MLTLDTLKNTSRPKKNVKRVGRGLGSGLGKTADAEKKVLVHDLATNVAMVMKAVSLECL